MYELRGQRVLAMKECHIAEVARAMCDVFGFNEPKVKRRKDGYAWPLEQLSDYCITLDIVDDKEWLDATWGSIAGHYEPSSKTIRIPNYLYERACAGDRYALSVVMHELGHLLLGHQAALHYSTKPATQNEDSEWQADAFADHALIYLGVCSAQREFDFN